MQNTEETYIKGLNHGYALAKAQYEVKGGHWVDNTCSVCQRKLVLITTPYCPWCGAEMQEDKDA